MRTTGAATAASQNASDRSSWRHHRSARLARPQLLPHLACAHAPVGHDRPARPTGAVAGFDLTFGAPKGVSILWGAGDSEVARDVREAHGVAVERALGYLEDAACLARRGRGGQEHVRGEGFVAAAFRHRSSRAGDPLLHTHGYGLHALSQAARTWP